MNRSESIKEISKALSKAQGEMGSADKSAENPFFNSNYANLSEVIKVIKKPFKDNGLSFSQSPMVLDKMAGVETIIMHTSGEFIESVLLLPIQKQDAQGVGSAITYAKRYALQAMAGVPSEDDDGEAASRPHAKNETIELPWFNDYEKMAPKFQAAIQDGSRTADDIIKNIAREFKISKEIREKIKGLK